jgi:hypothetical protein
MTTINQNDKDAAKQLGQDPNVSTRLQFKNNVVDAKFNLVKAEEPGRVAEAELIESSCCNADLYGEELGNDVLIRCSKCGAVQSPDKGDHQ